MELTNELTVIISMFAMVISMFAILTGFIVAVWRGQATLIQRIDERLQADREELRAHRKEDREEARANREADREELRAHRMEDREEARANRKEDREDFREFRTETRNSFNLTNQNIEKIAEQVGSHAERVATVEGYISAVSDR